MKVELDYIFMKINRGDLLLGRLMFIYDAGRYCNKIVKLKTIQRSVSTNRIVLVETHSMRLRIMKGEEIETHSVRLYR